MSCLALPCLALPRQEGKAVSQSTSTSHRLPDMPLACLFEEQASDENNPRTDVCFKDSPPQSPPQLHMLHMLAGWFPQEEPGSHAGSSTEPIGVDLQKRTRQSCTLATVAVCSRMEIWGGDEGKGRTCCCTRGGTVEVMGFHQED
jgi:hypothetical protein